MSGNPAYPFQIVRIRPILASHNLFGRPRNAHKWLWRNGLCAFWSRLQNGHYRNFEPWGLRFGPWFSPPGRDALQGLGPLAHPPELTSPPPGRAGRWQGHGRARGEIRHLEPPLGVWEWPRHPSAPPRALLAQLNRMTQCVSFLEDRHEVVTECVGVYFLYTPSPLSSPLPSRLYPRLQTIATTLKLG